MTASGVACLALLVVLVGTTVAASSSTTSTPASTTPPVATAEPSSSERGASPTTTPVATRSTDARTARAATTSVSAFGDSVMVGAKPALKKQLPGITVNAGIARQSTEAFSVVRSAHAAGRLGRVVVIHTGTNGTVVKKDLRRTIKRLADRRVVVVNVHVPRPWQNSNNRIIAKVVRNQPNAVLVKWRKAAKRNPQWFASDNIHLTPAGAAGFARLVRAGVTQ
jgi:lysophospholipase L1-like esterase